MDKLCLYLSLFAGLLGGAVYAETRVESFQHDAESRSYRLHLPATREADARLPLVLVLHGRSGNGQGMARLTHFDARADRHGFIVAYPNSLLEQWNYLHGIPGAADGPDDVGFLLKIVDRIALAYPIDASRVYVTGLSNGGFMAQRLACLDQSRFAAFASVAASGYAVMRETCENDAAIDALYLHGTDDRLAPWTGLAVADPGGGTQRVTLSVSETVKYWSAHNRCAPEVSAEELLPLGRSPGTRVTIYSAVHCPQERQVTLYAILGGGHNWPGVEGVLPPSVAGRVNLDIHASDVIWAFFERSHRNLEGR